MRNQEKDRIQLSSWAHRFQKIMALPPFKIIHDYNNIYIYTYK